MNLEQIKQAAFEDELKKIAYFKPPKGQKITASGIFAESSGETSKSNAEELRGLLKKHKKIEDVISEYKKTHPDSFITGIHKVEKPPKSGFLTRMIRGKQYVNSELESYKSRTKNPPFILRTGPSGSLNSFYKSFYDNNNSQFTSTYDN